MAKPKPLEPFVMPSEPTVETARPLEPPSEARVTPTDPFMLPLKPLETISEPLMLPLRSLETLSEPLVMPLTLTKQSGQTASASLQRVFWRSSKSNLTAMS